MPRFEPFAAVRYSPSWLDLADVTAPPYDVIGPDELARLEARSPYNVVRVDLPRDNGPQGRYDVARCRLDEWLAERVLLADEEPGFYVYRMGWRDDDGDPRQTSGVLGALELDPARTGAVLPHERTMAKPLDDRLRQLRHAQRAADRGTRAALVHRLPQGTGHRVRRPAAGPQGPDRHRPTRRGGHHLTRQTVRSGRAGEWLVPT